MKRKLLLTMVASFFATLAMPLAVSAAATTAVVTPSNLQGWALNPDPTNATPYEFTSTKASIGAGSLHVLPIDSVGLHKFIATKTLNVDAASVQSVAYDFLIAGTGTAADAGQYYLNVYTNLPSSTTFYDCRFDYAPTTGSTSIFTTATFNATDTPTTVTPRGAATCPTTLSGMPAGSKVSFVALNVGDTTTSDTGLAGYFDKAVITTTSDAVTYDFEALDVPTILTPANNSTTAASAITKVDWTDVTGATSYEYQAFSDAGYTSPLFAPIATTASEIPTPGTPPGNYYVRVRAVNADGTSVWSNGATNPYKITVTADPPALTYPTTKDDCKGDGWKTFTGVIFKNQGDCVSYVASKGKAKGNPTFANNPTF